MMAVPIRYLETIPHGPLGGYWDIKALAYAVREGVSEENWDLYPGNDSNMTRTAFEPLFSTKLSAPFSSDSVFLACF